MCPSCPSSLPPPVSITKSHFINDHIFRQIFHQCNCRKSIHLRQPQQVRRTQGTRGARGTRIPLPKIATTQARQAREVSKASKDSKALGSTKTLARISKALGEGASKTPQPETCTTQASRAREASKTSEASKASKAGKALGSSKARAPVQANTALAANKAPVRASKASVAGVKNISDQEIYSTKTREEDLGSRKNLGTTFGASKTGAHGKSMTATQPEIRVTQDREYLGASKSPLRATASKAPSRASEAPVRATKAPVGVRNISDPEICTTKSRESLGPRKAPVRTSTAIGSSRAQMRARKSLGATKAPEDKAIKPFHLGASKVLGSISAPRARKTPIPRPEKPKGCSIQPRQARFNPIPLARLCLSLHRPPR
jgi:hypothetical protein